MKKLAVIACGWHYPSQFYQKISEQKLPTDWNIELFVISHRHPENKNTIQEKDKNCVVVYFKHSQEFTYPLND